jgi:scyllo-inositol 2-dehydrogenase (NADP+)
VPAPWPGVDTGGHGRISLEFDDVLFQVETSRVCRLDRPRWWVLGTEGGFVKSGIDPQEEALRSGDIDRADELPEHRGRLRRGADPGSAAATAVETVVPTVRGHWDAFYANIVDAIQGRAPLAVTAEQAREVVRIIESATRAASEHRVLEGPWGGGTENREEDGR